MSQALQRALEMVWFDLRLNQFPGQRPALLRREQELLVEIAAQFRQETAILRLLNWRELRRQRLRRHARAEAPAPSGEETFRCPVCQHLVRNPSAGPAAQCWRCDDGAA
ncbi:MAG TPA: hypothetical protein VH598_11580 [Verrucomicrobiae bacterium]|jgi:hypothetical protein|nr:hypothetical protein [Verrucomicrobiae bacterium]